ncbi:ferroxidase fet3 [Coemansia sp. RSA 1813]|nr:ferroxidase fet3 [Coemansia sp. RSA 1646]KAJ1769436.1 ferroxidase fet3 [Coemansia sp. RSA 1843]KAJ2086280.1 ferroxidase fet3 [Coemansia sp. RSA 986]KAJ2212930.1 ferroxidase fet3 [Coemansia sp. RSA 487]KAJ2567605.1 ferroxidase fet3 [Coemansia sp. RSA 1813]
MLHRQLLLLLSAAIGISWAKIVDVNWNVEQLTVNRDGYNTRKAVGVNGKLPIPPVYINKGDTVALHVHNSLTVPTTVHFHGMFQNNTAYNDGAGMVSQCGIPPGSNFTYVVTPDQQEGTYWMHGHYHDQNADGLRTPFIIRDSDEPTTEYDDEYLFFLEDWYSTPFAERMNEVLDPKGTFPPPSSFPYGLINGYSGNDTKPIRFEPGKKYRIRVINMSLTEWFRFSIPGHRLQVIEVEGVRSEPYEVDGLDLGPAQRYSAIVEAKETDEFNYMYNVTLYANFVPFLRGMNPRVYLGLIDYGRPKATTKIYSRTSDANIEWADDIKMSAKDQEPLLEPVNTYVKLKATSAKFSDGVVRAILDTMPYNATSLAVPTLFSAMTMGKLATNPAIYSVQAQPHVVNHLDVVEIEIQNPTDIDHSFHLHGHTFQIVEYGPGTGANPNKTHVSPVVRHSSRTPIRRDTLVVRTGEYIKIRFRADNPGVWLFHCHMDIHFAMGLAITFIEAPTVLQERMTIPSSLVQMCRQQGVNPSGNAAGNQGLDLTGLPAGPTL